MNLVSIFLSVRANRASSISTGKRLRRSMVEMHFSSSVHLTNQPHRKDSILPDQHGDETSNHAKRWTPFANVRDPSIVSTKKSATDADLPVNKALISNKPIQTVASFSSLTDAVKNAMQKGTLGAGPNSLRRPASGSSISSKDLNHLSPQSM